MVKKLAYPPLLEATVGDDRAWKLGDAVLEKISKDCKISLTPQQRIGVCLILNAHVLNADTERKFPTAERAKEIIGLVTRLHTSSETFVKALRQLDEDNFQMLQLALVRAGFSSLSQYNLLNLVASFSRSCEDARNNMEKAVTGGRGLGKHPHLESLIWTLATVFEAAGGTASAAHSPNARGGLGGYATPFVQFVYALTQQLPKRFQISQEALGAAARRALKTRPATFSYDPSLIPVSKYLLMR